MTDLTVHAGVTWRIRWPITDEAGNPLDLTGYRVTAQIRPSPGADVLYHDFAATGDAAVEVDGVTLTLPASISAGFAWRSGAYDVHLRSPDGDVWLVDEGPLFVRPAVTVDA